MGNCLIVRKSVGLSKINKVAEIFFSDKIPTSQLYTTQTFNVKKDRKYIVISTGQSQRGDITSTPNILDGANVEFEVMSENVALYAHTKVSIVKATATQITVRGYSGFAMLFEF